MLIHSKKSCNFGIHQANERCPIHVVFFRPHGIQEWSHFKTLDMIPRPNATTSRLKKVYQRALGAKPMDVLDDEGQPYWEIPLK